MYQSYNVTNNKKYKYGTVCLIQPREGLRKYANLSHMRGFADINILELSQTYTNASIRNTLTEANVLFWNFFHEMEYQCTYFFFSLPPLSVSVVRDTVHHVTPSLCPQVTSIPSARYLWLPVFLPIPQCAESWTLALLEALLVLLHVSLILMSCQLVVSRCYLRVTLLAAP